MLTADLSELEPSSLFLTDTASLGHRTLSLKQHASPHTEGARCVSGRDNGCANTHVGAKLVRSSSMSFQVGDRNRRVAARKETKACCTGRRSAPEGTRGICEDAEILSQSVAVVRGMVAMLGSR